MGSQFTLMDEHVEAPHARPHAGKVVLSRLIPGRSAIAAPAPSLKLVLEGEELYQVDGRTVRVQPGQFLYLDAGEDCVAINRTRTHGLCLTVAGEAAGAGVAGHDPVLGRSLVFSARTSGLGRLLERYGRMIAADPNLGGAVAGDLVEQCRRAIAEPLGESKAAMGALKAAKASTRRDLFQRLERARGFLHDQDHRSVSLGELAAFAGLSQFHLARYFKTAFGEAPIAYHRSLRLKRAASLLREGAGLAQTADAVGYSDAVALSHAFRREYGQAPQQWAAQIGV